MMSPARIAPALRDRVEGEVHESEGARALYATAACLYRIEPLAVVWPRHAGDVSEVLKFAAAAGVPVAARGAGSGVAGQPLTTGIVLDLSRHMNRVLSTGAEDVVVEAGAVLSDVQDHLGPRGREVGPDPASGGWCTVGGMVATNSSGPHAPIHGTMRDWVLDAEAILSDGRPLSSRAGEIGDALARIAVEYREALFRERPRCRKSSSAYDLWALVDRPRAPADLPRFLCGSEGTLAVVTSVRLRTAPLPSARGSALLAFRSAGRALDEGLRFASTHAFSAAEFLDESLLDFLRRESPGIAARLPGETRAVLLLDLDAGDSAELGARLEALRRDLLAPAGPAEAVLTAFSEPDRESLWEIRRRSSPYLKTLGSGGRRPARFIEDAAVAVECLAEYVGRLRLLLRECGLEAPVFGHAGSGHLHLNPALDLSRESDRDLLERIALRHAELVRAMGGTLTGEHGDGRLRAPLLPGMFPRSFPAFREVRNLWDPAGILNPGVIVPAEGARVTDGMERSPGIGGGRMDGVEERRRFRRECDALGARAGGATA